MTSKEILLVDDDPSDVELTLIALQEHNLANSVVVAWDGAEALDYLYRRGQYSDRAPGNPVAVLLDLKMPKLSGLEVLHQVKNDPALKTIPIVMLTSSHQERDITTSYELGVNSYVVKPVIFEDFVQAVRQIGLFWVLTNETPDTRPSGDRG